MSCTSMTYNTELQRSSLLFFAFIHDSNSKTQDKKKTIVSFLFLKIKLKTHEHICIHEHPFNHIKLCAA